MPNRLTPHPRRALPWLLLAAFCLAPHVAWSQKASVKPGVNKNFEKPDAEQWAKRFEREGREPYDKRDAIVKASQVKPGMSVADVGAGTGLFTRLFARQVGPEGRVYATDIAREFIEHIEKTCQEAGLENVTGIVCTAEDSGLAPDSIDMAFICDTYHHFEFPRQTMDSIYRALRANGTVVVIDFRKIEGVSPQWIMGHVRANQEMVRKEIEAAGFAFLEDKGEMLKDNYFMRFRKRETETSGD
jgi:ubiquinone/menaquinone biosynthesis C-methylase UbiE